MSPSRAAAAPAPVRLRRRARPSTKARFPSASSADAARVPARRRERPIAPTASVSRNSLAMTIAGRRIAGGSGACQAIGDALRRQASRAGLAPASALLSTSVTVSAALNAGTSRAARSASRISVPRPGPSSMRCRRAGDPICCQTTAHHSPISSPNTWLISGAVMKSPARADGQRAAIVAVLGIVQAGFDVVGDADRAVAGRCAGRASAPAASACARASPLTSSRGCAPVDDGRARRAAWGWSRRCRASADRC